MLNNNQDTLKQFEIVFKNNPNHTMEEIIKNQNEKTQKDQTARKSIYQVDFPNSKLIYILNTNDLDYVSLLQGFKDLENITLQDREKRPNTLIYKLHHKYLLIILLILATMLKHQLQKQFSLLFLKICVRKSFSLE